MPGLILGILIYLGVLKFKKPYTIPALMVAVSVLFYVVVWVMDISIAKLRADGWLLASYASTGRWEFPLESSVSFTG